MHFLGHRLICEKYVPGNMRYFADAISDSLARTCVIRVDIDKITGKREKFDGEGIEMK